MNKSKVVHVLGVRQSCQIRRLMHIQTCKIEMRVPTEGMLKGEQWLHIIDGGVTGYESFQLTDIAIEEASKTGWYACAGTHNRWDTLYIPPEEMRKALQELRNG